MMAKLYVGTYAKYNAGSIAGKWLDLEDYPDRDAFLTACRELHKDEADPELMFQDFEGFPRALYSESYADPKIWAWLELDEDDRELLEVYQEHVNADADIEEARDAFAGTFDSAEDWAEQFIDECGMLDSMPENLRGYFDYKAYARDAGFEGMSFVRHDGNVWVFYSV